MSDLFVLIVYNLVVMNIINHEQNPSLKHAKLLNSLCSPLKAHGATFFGYTAVDSMNQAYCLGSEVDYAATYLQRALARNDVHTFDPEHKAAEQYLFWDFCQLDKDNEELYSIARDFDQSHTLTITKASDDLIQCYHFSGKNDNEQLNQYFLEHLDALHLFIDYFDECLQKIPEIAEVFQHPVSINEKSAGLISQPKQYSSQHSCGSRLVRTSKRTGTSFRSCLCLYGRHASSRLLYGRRRRL